MMMNMKKTKIVMSMVFMITLYSPRAFAFGIPLLSGDLGNLASSVKVIISEVMIIKQEVENNLRIIEEIRNGGFASAGAMIFEKIQNGDYDRFGQSLTTIRDESKNMSENVKARKEVKSKEEGYIRDGLSEKEAKLKAQKEVKDRLEKERKERMDAAQKAREQRGETAGERAYNWLKSNSAVTSGASSALRGVDSGNVGQIVSGASRATGGAVGDNTVGNIFSGASNSAGQAVNSAINGDIGAFISSTGEGAGAGLGAATGSSGANSALGGVGDVLGGVYNGDVGAIGTGLSNISSGTDQMNAETQAAIDDQREAERKAGEEIRKKNEELFEKYQKERKCNECISGYTNAGISQMEAGMRCVSSCQ